MFEHVHCEGDLLALELSLDAFEGVLHTEPEIDLLGGCTGRDVSGKFGHGLDFLDPRIDVGLELVEKQGVGEEGLRFNGIDRDTLARCV
jgi:hypothetical protein